MGRIKYRAEIDGLRALAVIPVIIFHLNPRLLPGGNIGVDVFFVISGFLITSIVKQELESGTFSFRAFWARRIRRIMPAMTVVIATCLAVTYFFVFKGDQHVIAIQSLAALLSFANLYFWRTLGDYWGPAAGDMPMLHMWSLSVEEQFYLFFPLAIWLVYRYRPQWLKAAILIAATMSFLLFLYGTKHFPVANFYWLPMRAWELAGGCFLAVGISQNNSKADAPLGLAGLCMILASYIFIPTLGAATAIAVLGAVLVIGFARSGLVKRILSQRYIVYIGKLSYSLYLWHWPVIVFAGYFATRPSNSLTLGITLVLSLASYYFVELTTRRRKGVVPIVITFYLVTVAGAALILQSSPLYEAKGFEQPTFNAHYYDSKPRTQMRNETRQIMEGVIVPPSGPIPGAYKTGGRIIGEGKPVVVVLGDSHGCMWSDPIHTVTEKLGLTTSFWTIGGVPPFISLPLRMGDGEGYLSSTEKYEYDSARLSLIKEWKPKIVILSARWDGVNDSDPIDLLDFLSANADHVLLIEQPPVLPIGHRNCLQYLCFQGITPTAGKSKFYPLGNEENYENGRARLRRFADAHGNIALLPTFDLYTSDHQVRVLDGPQVIYLDDNHLTAYGANLATDRLEKKVIELLGRESTQDSIPESR